jgi:hypothetical protein
LYKNQARLNGDRSSAISDDNRPISLGDRLERFVSLMLFLRFNR